MKSKPKTKNRIVEYLFETESDGMEIRIWCDADKCPQAKTVLDEVKKIGHVHYTELAETIANIDYVNAVQVRFSIDVINSESDYKSIVVYNNWP